MKNWYLLMVFVFICVSSMAQETKVLFIGNSYTGVNNLPSLVNDIADSVGDEFFFAKHTPGGQRLLNHAVNATAMAKINSEDWDYVVLQAQSQEPSFPIGQVETEVLPYATMLCDSIRANNPCTRPMFYMTWGRENGDANNCPNWPPVCTYEGMDSLLRLRYEMMGDQNEAYVAPVGAVWRQIRTLYPEIDLYANDGSHPSQAGSYAAALTFYTMIFQKSAEAVPFNYTLSDIDAQNIKSVVDYIVFADLQQWNVDAYNPNAAFELTQDGLSVSFVNNSSYGMTYAWDFGDDTTSDEFESTHEYTQGGEYTIQLITTSNCGLSDTTTTDIMLSIVSVNKIDLQRSFELFPNPSNGQTIQLIFVDEDSGKGKLTILDINGKMINEYIVSGTTLTIDVSSLAKGVYIVRWEGMKVQSVQTFVKQ